MELPDKEFTIVLNVFRQFRETMVKELQKADGRNSYETENITKEAETTKRRRMEIVEISIINGTKFTVEI